MLATVSLACASGVQAAPIFDFNVGPSLDSGGGLFSTAGGSSGTFHVTIEQGLGGTYQITVKGNDDGNIKGANPNPANPRNAVADVPFSKAGAGQVNLTIFDAANHPITLTAVVGGNTNYTLPVNGNVGGPSDVQPYGQIPAFYSQSPLPGAAINWTAAIPDNFIAPFGGNQFVGVFTASATIAPNLGQKASVNLQGDNEQWGAVASSVPEPAALAMLGTGLLPFGLVLRRRRSLA